MIDNLILNAVLDVAWYATYGLLKVGQEQFHAFFTLLAPFGVPAYRTYFRTRQRQYNLTLEQWITYTVAYCVLLLATRDAVEYLTLGHPILDNTLTVCRITLAVFWFSLFRNDNNDNNRRAGSPLNIWLQSIWPSDASSLRDSIKEFVLHMQNDLWLPAKYTGQCVLAIFAVLSTITQHIYRSTRAAWRKVPSKWLSMIVGVTIGTAFFKWTRAEAGSLHRWLTHNFSWVTRHHIATFRVILIVIVIAGSWTFFFLFFWFFAYIKQRIQSSPLLDGLRTVYAVLTRGFPYAGAFQIPDRRYVPTVFGAYALLHVALVDAGMIPPGTFGIRNSLASALVPAMPSILLVLALFLNNNNNNNYNNLTGWIYRSRVPRALSRLLLPVSIIAVIGYLTYTYTYPFSSSISTPTPLGVSFTHSQSNVVGIKQAKTPHQALVDPSITTTTPLHFILQENPPIPQVCPSAEYNPKAAAAVVVVTASSAKEMMIIPAKEQHTPIVELYEHEEVMIEIINMGQVCYDEDGEQLPCPYGSTNFKFATIWEICAEGILIVKTVVIRASRVTADALSEGMRKIAG